MFDEYVTIFNAHVSIEIGMTLPHYPLLTTFQSKTCAGLFAGSMSLRHAMQLAGYSPKHHTSFELFFGSAAVRQLIRERLDAGDQLPKKALDAFLKAEGAADLESLQ